MDNLKKEIQLQNIVPFLGVYDAFSAAIAAKYYKGLFVSGYSFAASYYGLPDIGLISWTDIISFVQRLRVILPENYLLVDIDDGYGDSEVAAHVVAQLRILGAAGAILEDQQRPRMCGHFSGKQIMELPKYLEKLRRVLSVSREMVIVARTDASEHKEVQKRVRAFADEGADAILIEAVRSIKDIEAIVKSVDTPIMLNQIMGGKSPNWSLQDLQNAGISMVIYSTPCLFAAQTTVEQTVQYLKTMGSIKEEKGQSIEDCAKILEQNLANRDSKSV